MQVSFIYGGINVNSFEIMSKKKLLHNIESLNNDPAKVKVDWGHTIQSKHDNEWIAVNDRLPQEGDCSEYLITDGEHCYVGHYRHDAKAWDSYVMGWIMHQCGGRWEDVPITHWRPLPELPN